MPCTDCKSPTLPPTPLFLILPGCTRTLLGKNGSPDQKVSILTPVPGVPSGPAVTGPSFLLSQRKRPSREPRKCRILSSDLRRLCNQYRRITAMRPQQGTPAGSIRTTALAYPLRESQPKPSLQPSHTVHRAVEISGLPCKPSELATSMPNAPASRVHPPASPRPTAAVGNLVKRNFLQ